MAIKQVLLYRRDLKMRKGKIAAQCAHAALAVFTRRRVDTGDGHLHVPLEPDMRTWVETGARKIVLSVEDEESLLEAYRLAQEAALPTVLITDSGRTEFGGVPTRTAVAIGPAAMDKVDAITGPDGLVSTKLA